MSRAKRRTRNTSRKRATTGLKGTVTTTDEPRSTTGPGLTEHAGHAGAGAARRAARVAPPERADASPPSGPTPPTTAPPRPTGAGTVPDGATGTEPTAPGHPTDGEPTVPGHPTDGEPTVPIEPVDAGTVTDHRDGDAGRADGEASDAVGGPVAPVARDADPRRPARGSSPRARTMRMRMRVAEAEPWSVTAMSFLLLGGLGVLTVVASVAAWGLAALLAPDSLPRLGTFLTIAFTVIALEVVLGSCLAALTTFLYNLTAPYNGGVEISLTDDLGPPEAGAKAHLAMDRAHIRARRYLRAHTPARVADTVRRATANCAALRGRLTTARREEPPAPGEQPVPVAPDAGRE
ncbi:DUF3566 domain-containing protein [Streptomyces sp. NPDC001068]|uniref:DUF3566 domain-containing protein n=1 Tax=Streptomyces sp. NPDC001068 TaxID=3364544 RepID=UPI003699D4E9